MPKEDVQDSSTLESAAKTRIVSGGGIQREIDEFDQRYLREATSDGFAWVDLTNPGEATLETLEAVCELHPLVMRSVNTPHRQSSVSIFDGSAHVVVRYPAGNERSITAGEFEIIILDRALVTVHGQEMLDIDEVLEHWNMTAESWRATTASMLYALLSVSLSRFEPIADRLDDGMETLEHMTINRARKSIHQREDLYRLFELTEYVTDLHNMALPLKDVLYTLNHHDEWFSDAHGRAWAQSVHDDAIRLSNRMKALRETGERMFDMVNSLITLQRADVSKQLTIVATIFLPLSFLGTYFGQNLQYMTDAVSGRVDFLLWGVGVPLVALAIIIGVMWRFGAFR